MKQIRIHAPQVHQGLGFAQAGGLPANPDLNTIWPQDDANGTVTLLAYSKINGIESWYPLVRGVEQAVYVHTQGVASDTWTVEHKLGTSDLWWQIRDSDGAFIPLPGGYDDSEDPQNKFVLKFSEPIRGRVVVVGAKAFSTPRLKTSLIDIGDMSITSDGLNYKGQAISMSDLAAAGAAGSAAAAAQLTANNAALDVANLTQVVSGVSQAAANAEHDAQQGIIAAAGALAVARAAKTTADQNTTSITGLSTQFDAKANKTGVDNTFAVLAGVVDGDAVNLKQMNDALAKLIGTAPANLDTLGEIATQLANDESAASAITLALAGKADKTGVSGEFSVGTAVAINSAVPLSQVQSLIASATPALTKSLVTTALGYTPASQSDMGVSINAQTGLTYQPVLSDGQFPGSKGTLVTLKNVGAQTVTIPSAANVAFPLGTVLSFAGLGAGKVTFQGDAGVTLQSVGGQKSISAQYGAVSLMLVAADTWLLVGSLSA